jgi:hypothetical protein
MKKNTSLFFSILMLLNYQIFATDYYVKAGGLNTNSGLDEQNALSTISEAMNKAIDGDRIIIIGSINQSGQVPISKSVSFVGQNNAVITGVDDGGIAKMYEVSAAAITASFSNITFTGSINKNISHGGVFSITGDSDITFTECIFDGNSISGYFSGGAISISSGRVTIANSLFKDNTAGRSGGAISVFASVEVQPQVTITGTSFYNNLAQGTGGSDGGGAIFAEGNANGTISISNCTFFENKITKISLDYGAAIRSTNFSVSVTNSLFYNNKINGGVGASSDFGSAPDGTQSFTYSIGEWISNNVDTRSNFISFVKGTTNPSEVAANLTNSGVYFDNTLKKVTFTAPSLLTDHTPIDFSLDNNDIGAWDSKINLFKGTTNSDWATGSNWSSTAAPTSLENVTLLSDSPSLVVGGSTNATINNLSVDASSSLTINSGGSLIVNGTSTGNVTYNRNLGTNNWYLVSSPVSGQVYNDAYVTANGIASGTSSNRGIASYTTADNTWSYFQAGGNSTFNNGQGYSEKRTASGDISFTGTINTADVSVAVSNASNGFNLVGNPFTSHVNSASFLTDNAANLVSETIWVWNQATENYETKVTVDAFVLVPTQGFFVRSSNGTNLNIAESYQASTGGTFQKTSKTEITLTMTDGSNNRFAKMYFLDNATKGFDNGFDGETFGGIENTVDVFTNLVENNEGKKYQVQSLPIDEMETMIVPVGVKAAAGKEITFTAEAINLPGDVKVFLEDRVTNTFTRLDEANSSYKVTLNDALNGTGRFFLHTKSSAVLSTDDVVLQNTSVYAINNNTLKVVGLPSGNATVKMYSILGKQVMQTSFSSTGVKEISLPKLSTGMYIVQVATATGKLNKKIVLE